MNASAVMRSLLAQEGIFLDEPAAAAPTATSSPTTCDAPDREVIREILLERGAPLRDLDWLVASCPSMAHALAFEPTPWMLRDFADDYLDQRPDAAKGRP